MDAKKIVYISLGCLSFVSSYAADQVPLFSQPIQKDNFFYNAELVYGGLSDYQGDITPFADIKNTADKSIRTYLPKTNDGWGFKLSAGYHLDVNHLDDVEVNYLNLQNSGQTYVSGQSLKNLYTQIGSSEFYDYTNGQANVSSSFRYQTANLNKISYRILKSVPSIKNSWIYGVRISGIDKTLNLQYSNIANQNNIDSINYTRNIFGIGPQFGGGTKWALTNYIDIGGNLTGGIIFGSNTSDWNESVTNPVPAPFGTINAVSYAVHHAGNGWASLIFSGELAGGVHYETRTKDYFKLEGGVYADQYASSTASDSISNTQTSASSNVKNKVSFSNQFCFRDVFIRFSYRS